MIDDRSKIGWRTRGKERKRDVRNRGGLENIEIMRRERSYNIEGVAEM